MGVNNHGQTMIFACAFLSDETIPSFVWLFNQFLDTMPGDAPKMIITDQDPAMTNAISLTLPNTYHRYCSWHILTKFSEKIDSVKYNDYYKEFSDCIWNSECEEEFDSTWLELVEKSGLNDNKWLQSMYEIRSRWVPAYVNHIFSAGMSSSQRAESAHAFFKRYVSKRNSLLDFMIQFSRGLERQRHEELMEDHKDITEKPKLKIPHDFLEQMLDIYTHEIFYKFQDEFWESFNFKFELLEEDDNYHVYNIFRRNFAKYKVRQIHCDKDLDYARCTCKKFESWGIPCRHVLAYLNKYCDLDKLPSQYILKRWTKIAKSGGVIDGNGMEIKDDKSYLLMRSQLIKYSLDLIDKALTSKEATKVYTDALSNANENMDLIVGGGAGRTNQMIGGGTSISKSVNMSCNYEHSYNEPKQVRAKGYGKRLKGGKEKALVRGKNPKARKCNGCGKVGMTHDKRNCPILMNRTTPPNEDATLVASLDDNSDSSTGWAA